MTENTNPSVVNDESGNNYGGINEYLGSGVQEAQLDYLENLSRLAQKMPPKDVTNQDFFPDLGRGIQVGAVSTKTVGSVPIFAAGTGLFPFAALNEMKRARAEAEWSYYEKMKAEMDKPLFDQKLQLADPWRQPAFSQKVMDTVDSYLALYAQKFGGDMGKAYIATKSDPNFQRTIQSYADYARMYDTVYKKALEIEQDVNDKEKGMNVYVSPDGKKTIDKFLYSHDNLTNLKPDELQGEMKKMYSTFSAISLAKALTEGYKDQIVEGITKSSGMSTDEQDVYITTQLKNEGVADQIIKSGLEAYPYLKSDPEQQAIFEREIRNRVAFGKEQAINTIKKNNADRNIALQKMGWADEEGNVKFQTKPSTLINAMGENAVSYPADVKPMPTPTGMNAFVVVDKRLRYVKLLESYQMVPTSEYDITKEGSGVMRGRYIEGKVKFQSSEPYAPGIIKPTDVKGQYQVVDEGRSTTQVKSATVQDAVTGEELQIFGETTIMTPYDNLKTTMEATIPNLGYVHEQLDKMTYPEGGRRGFPLSNENKPEAVVLTNGVNIKEIKPDLMYLKDGKTISGKELWNNEESRKEFGIKSDKFIPITDGMDIEDIKPDLMYTRNGKIISGQELLDRYNAQNK